MASSVYHVGLGLELNLTEPDLGHPEITNLWERLYADKRTPVSLRQLQCMECREARPHCPEWMVLVEVQGRRHARHHNPSIPDHPSNESDQHKAFKERIAKAAEAGGFSVEIEDRAEHGRRRTDVLVRGAGDLLVGHEVQLSYAALPSVRKRAKLARADGITPLWTTVDANRDFINQVPWALTDDAPWKDIYAGRQLQIRGGVRSLQMERCDLTNPKPCPVRGYGKCGKLHGRWVPTYPYELDELVRSTASGDHVPVIVPGKRMHFRWWVRAVDRERFADSAGGLLSEDDLTRARKPATAPVAPRPLDGECRYGQESEYRAAPAPARDDSADVPVLTEAAQWPTPPPLPIIRRGHCGAGPGPCGVSPARFYACGWRCEEHRP
ncbi:hypothetical protein ACFYUV_20760 [Nonomuraea sp. NPDC003560]|uniref:competence protein CoiA family protein n=1 Tax=Nonomuraea sp. NPDC003560 TaxID=3364341 RepID=UPI0036CFBC87